MLRWHRLLVGIAEVIIFWYVLCLLFDNGNIVFLFIVLVEFWLTNCFSLHSSWWRHCFWEVLLALVLRLHLRICCRAGGLRGLEDGSVALWVELVLRVKVVVARAIFTRAETAAIFRVVVLCRATSRPWHLVSKLSVLWFTLKLWYTRYFWLFARVLVSLHFS